MSIPRTYQEFTNNSRVFSYPFWIYVAPNLPTTRVIQVRIENFTVRVYPPFRSGDANTLPIPSIKVENIPFAKWLNPNGTPHIIEPIVLVPMLRKEGENRGAYIVNKADHNLLPPDKPMDSLRLDIYGQTENGTAGEINRKVIELIRYRTNQWWIGKSVDGIIGFNVGIAFGINREGSPIGPPAHVLDVSGDFVGGEESLNPSIWEAVGNDLVNGFQPPIADILLLDAKYYFAVRDFRRFVIDAATACEYIKDNTFMRLWSAKNGTPYNRDKVLGRWDMTNHLDTKLLFNFGISYKQEFPQQWEEIRDLWDARGNVSHGGLCVYGSNQTPVERQKALTMLGATEHCIKWLEALN